MRGGVENDADVLLSLSALIKAGVLWIVFEGILFLRKKKKDAPIKVRVLRAPEGREKSLSTQIVMFLCRSQQDLQYSVAYNNLKKSDDGKNKRRGGSERSREFCVENVTRCF